MTQSPFIDHTVLIPGPSFHIELAGLDARHPVHYSQRLLIFRCSSPEQRDAQLAAFKTGLKALVIRCPVLGGTVVPLPPDEAKDGKEDWRTIVPGNESERGIELIVRDLTTSRFSFEELKVDDFPPLKLRHDLLWPIPEGLGNDRPFAACKMQFSAIEGGTILTWAMSHSVADGSGNNELMRVLSEETKNAQDGASVKADAYSTIGLDRNVMCKLKSEIPFNIDDHPAHRWDTNPAAKRWPPEKTARHPFEASSREVLVLLRISPAKLAQLKTDATTPGAPFISTHDSIVALIWRSIILIRSRRSASAKAVPTSTLGRVFLPSDARRHLNLPPDHVGNCVYQLTASLELGILISPSGLQLAARALRSAINAVTPALATSLLAKTNEQWPHWKFMDYYSTTGVAIGTDWTYGMLYGQDWGQAFGPLIRYRFPGDTGGAGCGIFPRLPDGTAEVVVGVLPEEIEMLKGGECFGMYLESR